MAQEMINQNTDRKTFFIDDKKLKKIILKKTTIALKKNFKTRNGEVFKHFSVSKASFLNDAFSVVKLKEAWLQIKVNKDITKKNFGDKIVNNVKNYWFESMSRSLLNGTFKYPKIKKVNTQKVNPKFLTIINFRTRIIERSLLNHLTGIFEGVYVWVNISKVEFKNAKTYLNVVAFKNEFKAIIDQQAKKYVYKKKHYIVEKIFKSTNFGFRTDMSAHQAFYHIKTTWSQNTTYFLDYDVTSEFKNTNIKKLKDMFNRYVANYRIWKEIEKMLNMGYIQHDILKMQDPKLKQTSILSFFLYNVYMHDFDEFMENLSSETNYIQYIRYGDEMLISLVGTRKLAIYAQKKINSFIKNNLHLCISKSKIFFRDQLPVTFLGHKIK